MKGRHEETPPCLYLVYGNNETEVSDARYELVCSLLTPEERDAGLTEIRSAGNAPLKLDSVHGEIIAELGASSFLADSRRVVVVYDLADFFESRRTPAAAAKGRDNKDKKEKKDTSGRIEGFLEWMRDILPTTGNIAIFVCTESDEKQKSVSEKSELFQFVAQHGKLILKREKPLNFDFEDALLSGNGPGALIILREWMRRTGSNTSGRLKIYSTLANAVELALQARCRQLARDRQIPEAQVAVANYPSLDKLPGWKADKIGKFARRFEIEQLRKSITQLHRLQRVMYPTGNEDYILNWEEFIENIVMELTMARP